ncbi:hypothetical protein VPH35_124859 [Triticum aestivum]
MHAFCFCRALFSVYLCCAFLVLIVVYLHPTELSYQRCRGLLANMLYILWFGIYRMPSQVMDPLWLLRPSLRSERKLYFGRRNPYLRRWHFVLGGLLRRLHGRVSPHLHFDIDHIYDHDTWHLGYDCDLCNGCIVEGVVLPVQQGLHLLPQLARPALAAADSDCVWRWWP